MTSLYILIAASLVFLTFGLIVYTTQQRKVEQMLAEKDRATKKLADTIGVLNTIRRERMLFTRHPKFREVANTISRLCN